MLDNHQSALSVTGDLAVHERQVGGVQLYVTADDFKVIDNEMGNVRINSDLQIAGELRSPRVEGDLGVDDRRVNLDEIIALVGDSAYATEQTEYLTQATPTPTATPQPAPIAVRRADDGRARSRCRTTWSSRPASLQTPGSRRSASAR